MTVIFELAARIQSAGAAEELLLLVVKATLILLVARLLIAALPRASAATRHLLATVGLLAALLLPAATLVTPPWHVAVRTAETAGSAGTIGVTDAEESTLRTAISFARATGVVPERPLSAVDRATRVISLTWKGWIVLWFLVPGALMLLHMLAGIAGVRHVTKHATPLLDPEALRELESARKQLGLQFEVGLLTSERISVPVLWGVIKPVLLLPPDVKNWPAERLRVVLLHELAHLKRYDGLSLIASRAAVALFWFHPLAWSLERAARSECERACDDLVLAGGTRPSEYADHLLAIARSMPTFDPFRTVTLAMSRKSQLEGRLLSILQPQVVRRVLGRRGVAIASVIAIAILAPLAALRVIAAPPEAQIADSARAPQALTSDSSIEVTPELDALGDFVLAGLGKASGNDSLSFTPKNGKDWYDRAFRLYHSERYDEAGPAFEKAASLGHDRGSSLYNAACSYALIGSADRSLAALNQALDAGWKDTQRIGEDSDFDPIRNDPRFAALLKNQDLATGRLTETVERFESFRHGQQSAAAPSGNDWMEVGLDLLRLRRTNEAVQAFEKAIAAGYKSGTAAYNIACAYSLGGDSKNGLIWLDRAIEDGFSSEERLRNDPDITLLRLHPQFKALATKAADLEMRGCCDHKIFNLFKTSPDWKAAADHHQQMTARYPQSGRAWFNHGYTALQARDYPAAQNAYRRTIELQYRVGTSAYNLACAYALQGNRDAAFEWLERSRGAGFDLSQHLSDDDDLDALHGDARWTRLESEMERERKQKKIERVRKVANALASKLEEKSGKTSGK